VRVFCACGCLRVYLACVNGCMSNMCVCVCVLRVFVVVATEFLYFWVTEMGFASLGEANEFSKTFQACTPW